jgi:glycosyltransferase involved in cell wall biosynthesis
LILCEYASLNGGERSLLSVVGRLREHGFAPTVAAPLQGPLAAALRRVAIPMVCWVRQDDQGQAARRQELRALIQDQAPDIVHANSLSMSRLAGPVIGQLRLPSVGHLRDILRLSGQATSDLGQHARLLAVSHAVARWYVGQGIDSRRMRVVHNGVDLEEFRPRPQTGGLRRELQLPVDAPCVLSVGQVGMRKGLDTLVEAASRVLEQRPDVYFLHAGLRYSEKQEAIEFEEEVRDAAAPMGEHFCWLGLRDDVPRMLNEVTLLAHAARQEPLGRVLLEAAAAGLPVVATDVGGTSEIFPPGRDATCLVPADQPARLADAIVRVLADHPLRRRMAAAGRQLAERHFNASQAAARLAAQYRELLGTRNNHEISEIHEE